MGKRGFIVRSLFMQFFSLRSSIILTMALKESTEPRMMAGYLVELETYLKQGFKLVPIRFRSLTRHFFKLYKI